MAYSLLVSTSAGSSDGNTATTGGIDTSGANLLVAVVADFVSGSPASISDSKFNTWHNPLSRQSSGAFVGITIYYAYNPTVGGSHSFQASLSSSFPSIAVMAFSGATTTDPIDASAGAGTGSGTSLGSGTVSPSQDNEVIGYGLGFDATNTPSISSPATIAETVAYSNGQHFGLCLAYEIQTTATAANRSWTWSTSTDAATQSASFKAAAAAGGGKPWLYYAQQWTNP